MIGWIIQVTIVSIILILLLHNLINYFKDTFTVPKIKDLVNEPTQRYQEMYDIINNRNNNNLTNNNSNSNIDDNCTLIDSLPTAEIINEEPLSNEDDVIDMKNELKNFLKSQG